MFRLPVSHREPKRPPGPKQSFKVIAPRTVETTKSWAVRFFGNTWFPPRWPTHLHDMPREGVIRAVAYEAVRRHRKATPEIPLFERVLRVYCRLVTGRTDRYAVGEFVYEQLRDKVAAEYRRHRWRMKSPLTRQDLERVATLVLNDVEREILQLAADGRVLDRDHPRGYVYVRAQTKEGGRPCFITLGRPDRLKGRQILCLQTPDKFDRGMRRKLHGQHDDYRNYHPIARR